MRFKQALALPFLCALSLIVHSQTGGYTTRWRVVDSLINQKDLPASALEEVNKVYALARRENNEPQAIKALVYRLKLEQAVSEDGVIPAIKQLEKDVDSSRQPVRAILENLLAGLYQEYLAQNFYKLRKRTNTNSEPGPDIAGWTAEELNRKIVGLFLASLKEERQLAQINPMDYEPILLRGNVSRLRPTLFDLLAHTAITYFKNSPSYLFRPGWSESADTMELADAAGFAGHHFSTTDTLDGHYQAIRLYQRLIRQHLADKEPDALVDVDIERITCVDSYVTGTEDRYMNALSKITDRYGDLSLAAQAWYLQASVYHSRAGLEPSPDSAGNWKAKAICEKVLAEKDSSEGKANCHNLLHTILEKSITLTTEKVNIPYQPFRALVRWKNSDRLYLRLIRLESPMAKSTIRAYDSVYLKRLLQRPVYRAFVQDLPETRDMKLHSAEMAIGSLPPGEYALAATTDSSWSLHHGVVAVENLSVSSIAYISQGDDYFVVNRETGHPLAGAAVQLWTRLNEGHEDPLQKREAYTTDRDGHFTIKWKQEKRYGVVLVEITIPGDHLFPSEGIPNWFLDTEDTTRPDKKRFEEENAHSFLFTDRSIYRPGQTMYFKGITVTQDFDTRRSRIMPDHATTVFVFNPNDQTLDTIRLTTNAFGSYNGHFKLPENQMNGNYRLFNRDGGQAWFSVEEYKRPKFYVQYEKQKGSFRVGDSIRITGMAMGYAGNGIGGATVSYRVVRNSRYTYTRSSRINMGFSRPRDIAQGKITTDAAGKFSFLFYAAPDAGLRPDSDPEFHFEISADVTDIDGETRSASTELVTGYKALKLSIHLPQGDQLPADSFRQVLVDVRNLAGERTAADVGLAIYALQTPKRLIRKRLWLPPDRYILSEKEWLDSFPHDEYRQESDKEDWARGEKVWDARQSGAATNAPGIKAGQVSLVRSGPPLRPGWYVVEAKAVDSSGQEVKDLTYMQLYDGKTGAPGSPEYLWEADKQATVEPGQQAAVSTGSSAADVYVIRTVERRAENNPAWKEAFRGPLNNIMAKFGNLTLNEERKQTEFPITQDDRGGFGVLDAFVKDNRFYSHWTVIDVPWTNKQLDIHYSTFRDKTEPGSQEKWQLHISGRDKEKVSAEVLTSMYDASLDQFKPHGWGPPYIYPSFDNKRDWLVWSDFNSTSSQEHTFDGYRNMLYSKVYDRLMTPGDAGLLRVNGKRYFGANGYRADAVELDDNMITNSSAMFRRMPGAVDGVVTAHGQPIANIRIRGTSPLATENIAPGKEVLAWSDLDGGQGIPAPGSVVQPRKDFRETAFFFPDLQTDSAGNVNFSFTMPEAVTTWKWLTLAGSRDLAFGYSEQSVVTQKELMVQPNMPRFLREGDKIELQVKVINLTDSELTGQMSLELTDPTTGQTADGWFVNRQPNQYFTVGARQSFVVGFPLDIPYQYNRPLTYRIVAQAAHYSDGEEGVLPVVSNRQLVTESLPLNLRGDGERSFTFDKLLKSGSSETLNNHSLTVEFTANPAWYAVQSLPYLMEYPYACAEQTFERVYANALASKIATSSPRLQQELKRWRDTDTSQLLSNLQKNQELKTVLLEETPWVLQGKNEAQQKKNIALLFDLGRMSGELESSLDRLKSMQSPNGAFPWFKGGPDDRYITQYIVTGIGHLQKLQAITPTLAGKIDTIVKAALPYLDGQLRKDYEEILAAEKRAGRAGVGAGRPGQAGVAWIGELPIQYLYMRSLFSSHGIPGNVFPAVNYFRKKAQQGWIQRNNYLQGMIALALYRTGDVQTAKDILASLKQRAIRDEEKGMYWKGMEGGYYWYNAPVETQSLMIEAFREIGGDAAIDRDLKTWLLKQKQTHSWPTTTATANACYALLLGGQDWLNEERTVVVRLGDKTVRWPEDGQGSGIGYDKKIFDGPFVNPGMGNITVTMSGNGKAGGSPAWGAVYWQYFDMLDRITPTGGSKPVLSLSKRLFVQRNTDRGPVLDSLADNGTLHPGDRVVVRIVLRADRDLEYVHMKDMRAACMEPVNVLSQYKWQDGLGYYESTKDASTDFFFGYLPRGTHVFEYTLLAGQEGNFSDGITSIECLYAPEFSYHSEGIRVNVEASK